jgi:hypothetical protein
MIVGRRLLEVLVNMYRDGAPSEVIADVEHAMELAASSSQRTTYLDAALAAEYLEEHQGGDYERTDVREIRGMLYEIAAYRTLMWQGTETLRQEYLDRARQTLFPSDVERQPIAADDHYIGIVHQVLAEISKAAIDSDKPVGSAHQQLRLEARLAQDGYAGKLREIHAIASELAGYRLARFGDDGGCEARARTWRDRARRYYVQCEQLAGGDEDRQRIKGRQSHVHLVRHGFIAPHVDTSKFSHNLQEAIDLAQVRRCLGFKNGTDHRVGLTDADVLLGLYLVEGSEARHILSSLGVREQQLRDAVRSANENPPRSVTPAGLMIQAVLHTATERAQGRGYKQIGTEHLLYALTATYGATPAKAALERLAVDPRQIQQKVNAVSPDIRGGVVSLQA